MKNYFYIAAFFLLMTSMSQAQAKKWTLEECVEYAQKNNISIAQSDIDNQVAGIDRKDAIGNFVPSINGNASHSWNIGLNQNITTGLLENQTTQFTSAGVSVGVDIYKGLQNQNKLRRAKLSALAASYQLSKIRDDVSLNVANAFLQILFNKENLKVQTEQLANNKRQMNRTEEMVKAGSVPAGDLLDMKATVATSQKSVVDAENALLISKLSLAQLLQLREFKDFDVEDRDYDLLKSEVMSQTANDVYQKAKEARYEIKIARTNLEIAERDVKISKGAYQPSITGFYSFSTRAAYADRIVGQTPDTENPFAVIGTVEGTGQNVIVPNYVPVLARRAPLFDQFSDNKGHSFGLQLNVPILNGFSARNGVQRSKLALERSKVALSQAELDLERNVYQAFTDANGALNAYESALVAVEARESAFNYAKEKYAVGMMNSFDFNQAQTLFVNAQSDVARAKFEYIFKVKVVEFYFGIPINKI
ncbi:TolC family protein [Flavobacterium silvaticum]|uniref:TolC family protein n=1 Tax=Flavobacterium silvaticum TaxID=1852020 RepID=A0A972JGQ4_9FLAO|nr:TolC family protein [Flavobacterium silvaticum]NMH27120.1 TolC family protein [Flavobacterium silvaticum]